VALRAFASLPPELQRRIVERGDELAAQSVTLAHAYFVSAVAVAARSISERDVWERAGRMLLGADGNGRAAAQAFFRLDARRWLDAAVATRTAWTEAAADLLGRSQRLATAFVETTGKAVCDHPRLRAESISAWHRAIVQTSEAGRWRGEFLAARLTESATDLLPVLAAEAVPAWASTFTAIGSAGRNARCPEVPPSLAELTPTLQEATLGICARVAATDPVEARRMLDVLPHAAASLTPIAARALLAGLDAATGQPGLADAIALLPAVARPLDTATIEELLAGLPTLAIAFPAGTVAYLRSMDRAYEEGGSEGVALWRERGIEIGTANREAGIAHFRLESRTSHKILVQRTTAVAFEEVEPVMRRYLLMMARRPFHLTSGQGVWYRPPLGAAEDTLARLPERVDLCDTSEENQLFYKLSVAHAAARWEYGTYDLSVARMAAAGVLPSDFAADGDDVIAFLDAFPNPLLAAGLFVLLDGIRLDAALERDFAGLAPQLDRLGRFYASHPPPAAPERSAESVLEAVFLMSVGRLGADALPPRLLATGHALEPIVARLRSPEATVYDTARYLLSFYGLLTLATARPEDEDQPGLSMEVGGATVMDLYDDDDAPPTPAPAGAGPTSGAEVDVEGDVGEHTIPLELGGDEAPKPSGGMPLSPEEIRKLIEQGVDLKITEGHGEQQPGLGLYITDLLGKLPAATLDRLREMVEAGDGAAVRAWLEAERGGRFHYYDEWDYTIADYRRHWCRVCEQLADSDSGSYFHGTMAQTGDLIARIKREFQLMRPEQFRKVRHMEDGEELDLNALIDAHADRRTRRSPSERLYVARRREERDVATLFLVDMSASTDEPLEATDRDGKPRRVIDLIKDTLVVMSTVLDEIGDAYALYGFSGHGRDDVEYYHVKAFRERLGAAVRTRIGGIEPKRSTRMGAALRHSAGKLAAASAKARYLILLSDGFPQDFDYGDDRKSNVYGIRDTMMALQELEKQGVRTFCITVDPAGHDYLGDMCPPSRYAVIDDIEALPEELPRIYRSVTRY
jgi:nitric oxide reductase NorD protein